MVMGVDYNIKYFSSALKINYSQVSKLCILMFLPGLKSLSFRFGFRGTHCSDLLFLNFLIYKEF